MMQNFVDNEKLKRLNLYRELNDKKQPQFGSFNRNYIQKMSAINPLINQMFQENYEQETTNKWILRNQISKQIRNSKK